MLEVICIAFEGSDNQLLPNSKAAMTLIALASHDAFVLPLIVILDSFCKLLS